MASSILLDIGTKEYLGIVILFLVFYAIWSRPPWKKLPPGPPVIPILGSLPFLPVSRSLDIQEMFKRMEDKYGKVWMARLGVNNILVLADYKVIHEALVTKAAAFGGRPPIFMFTDIFEHCGVAATRGKMWEHNRRHLMRVLKNFGYSKTTMEEFITAEVEYFLGEIQANSGQAIDPTMILKKALSNIICCFAFGERRDYKSQELKEHIQKQDQTFIYVGNNSPLNAFPYSRYIPGDIANFHKTMRLKQDIFGIYNKWIENHRSQLNESDEPKDFIDAYLMDMIKSQGNGEKFSETHLRSIINELFIGGTDTSSSTLAWAILYMALYPDIQIQVQDEIDDVVSSSHQLTYAARNKLPLSMACISESERLGSVVPFGIPHATVESVILDGYFIPKDTMVLAHTRSVHMNPETWPEPERFDPGRFLDEHGHYKRRDELIPFMIGKRMCLGANLAHMELFFFFVSLLCNYNIRIPDMRIPPTTKGKLGLTYHPAECTVIFEKRLK